MGLWLRAIAGGITPRTKIDGFFPPCACLRPVTSLSKRSEFRVPHGFPVDRRIMRQPFLCKMVPQLAHSLEFLVAGSGLLLPLMTASNLFKYSLRPLTPEKRAMFLQICRWGSLDIRLGSQTDFLHSAFSQQIQRPLVPQAALQEK